MIVKFTIGCWRFTSSMAPIVNIIGVDSTLDGDDHIIMWDFDAAIYTDVRNELLKVQRVYELPNIYISETSKDSGYHAWCFKRVSWRKLVEILAFTHLIDWHYFKYGIYRGHFTLRVSTKCGRKKRHVEILRSKVPDDVTIHDLKKWVNYETLADGRKSHSIKLEIH